MGIVIPYRGVIEIVGEHDVGKTLAALQILDLSQKQPFAKAVFVDDDEKGEGTVRQLAASQIRFEKYFNIGDLKAKVKSTNGVLAVDDMLSEVIFPIVDSISQSDHEVIIWDTWRAIYQSARGHVQRNQKKYNDAVTWQGNSIMINGLISRVAREMEKGIIEKLKAHCEVLVMTHHLKDFYEGNVKVTGSYVPESSKVITEVCNMRIWLVRNPNSKVPSMLFLKRPNLPVVTKGGIKFVNIVPMKIVPKPEDETIWDAMARYEKNPIESRPPNEDETPTPEEFAMLSGTLTPGQKSYVSEMLKYMAENEKAVEDVENAITEEVEETTDGINGDVDKDYPKVPATAVELLDQAMKLWKMTADEIEKKADYGLSDLLTMDESEISGLWETLVKLNE